MSGRGPKHRVTPGAVQILSAPFTRYTACTILVVLFASCIPRTYMRMALPDGNDLTIFLASARALVRGGNPYSTVDVPQSHGPYLFTIDLLVIPLTWIPTWLAQAIWFGLSVAALIGALLILDRLWARATRGESPALAIPFVVRFAALVPAFFVPLQNHLSFGQQDLMILLVCCLFLEAQLRRREFTAAMWLGCAVALKITPILLAVDLVVRRKYRALLLTGVWIVVWAVLLPGLVAGQLHVLTLYRDWWFEDLRHHLDSTVSIHWRTRFTLAALVVRIWPSMAAVPGLYYWAAAAVLVPLVALTVSVGRDPRNRLMLFGLYLGAMPLVSPISETHHLTILFGTLWLWLLAAGSTPYMPTLDGLGATLFVALHWLGIFKDQHAPAGPRVGSVFDAAALLVLYVILVVRLYLVARRSESGSAASTPHEARNGCAAPPSPPTSRVGPASTGRPDGGSWSGVLMDRHSRPHRGIGRAVGAEMRTVLTAALAGCAGRWP